MSVLDILFEKKKLELLSAAIIFNSFSFGPLLGVLSVGYLLTTRFKWFTILYFLWIYYDRKTPHSTGRRVRYLYEGKFWKHLADYFEPTNIYEPGFSLNPTESYLFCCFPHGMLPLGAINTIWNYWAIFHKIFPQFIVYGSTLNYVFYVPFVRELALSFGFISNSYEAISNCLNKENGGNILMLYPGNGQEVYYSTPGKYRFVLKNKKGFIKLALRNGKPIVPVITFGEIDLFQQISIPRLKPFQEFIRKIVTYPPVLFYGRGFTENSIGLIPRKRKLTSIVGKPIKVAKCENPNQLDIDLLHETFVNAVINLFDTYKSQFLDNPNEELEIV